MRQKIAKRVSNGFVVLIYPSWSIRLTGVCVEIATISFKFATEHDIDQQAGHRAIALAIKQYFHSLDKSLSLMVYDFSIELKSS